MRERRAQDGEAVAAAARGAGEVDDERRPTDAGDAAGEQAVRRLRDRVGTQRLRDPGAGGRAPRGRLGRHVARRRPVPPVVRTSARVAASWRARGRSRAARRARPAARPRSPRRQAAPRARRRSGPCASPRATPSETVSTAALTPAPSSSRAADLGDDHLLVDRLRHVVDGQGRDGRGHERLHLDSRLRRRLRGGDDLDTRPSDLELDVDGESGS